MKIIIKDDKQLNLRFYLPTGIVLNRFTAFFLPSFLKKQNIQITRKQIVAFSKVLRRYKHSHPDWIFIEAHDSSGNHITFKL
ncbi:hypothetical protein [Negativibacillus massiliensis]|uniref:hypothetical protein n=1 Tax=Negativibacillus massiliensis TaxID=1871035 RepID=UPI003AF26722